MRLRVPPEVMPHLSAAARPVAELVNKRMSVAAIAAALHLSVFTVKVRRAAIIRTMRGLGLEPYPPRSGQAGAAQGSRRKAQ